MSRKATLAACLYNSLFILFVANIFWAQSQGISLCKSVMAPHSLVSMWLRVSVWVHSAHWEVRFSFLTRNWLTTEVIFSRPSLPSRRCLGCCRVKVHCPELRQSLCTAEDLWESYSVWVCDPTLDSSISGFLTQRPNACLNYFRHF